jgi:hypothetical protein
VTRQPASHARTAHTAGTPARVHVRALHMWVEVTTCRSSDS